MVKRRVLKTELKCRIQEVFVSWQSLRRKLERNSDRHFISQSPDIFAVGNPFPGTRVNLNPLKLFYNDASLLVRDNIGPLIRKQI